MSHMGSSFKDFKLEMLANPEVKREYDALEPDRAVKRRIAAARYKRKVQLARAARTGAGQCELIYHDRNGIRVDKGINDLRKQVTKIAAKQMKAEIVY